VGEVQEAQRATTMMTSTEQPREFIESFLAGAKPGNGIGVNFRDGRHFAGDFESFDGRVLRLELTFGRPEFNWAGERRPDGPIAAIPFAEIASVEIEHVIEEQVAD
jgi:hypothetical protein